MNKIEKGKKGLIWLGIIAFVVAVVGIVAGTWIIIACAKGLAGEGSRVGNIIGIVAGSLLEILSFSLIFVGIHFVWIGAVLKATNGSIKDDDLCKGTVNMIKCPKCGSEVAADDKVCGNCGAKLQKTVVCPGCGEEVAASKKFCTKCGAELKKQTKTQKPKPEEKPE